MNAAAELAILAPLTSAMVGAAIGISNPICYVTTHDRLAACSLKPGHAGPHNTRHDHSGQSWR